MELQNWSIGVAAVNCDSQVSFCGSQNLTGWPTLRLYRSGGWTDLPTHRPLPQPSRLSPAELWGEMGKAQEQPSGECRSALLQWRASRSQPVAVRTATETDAVHLTDLLRAAHGALAVSKEHTPALRPFAAAIRHHFPDAATRSAMAAVSTEPQVWWRHHARLSRKRPLPPWRHCASGGFPCSLWLLFHALVADGGEVAFAAVAAWVRQYLPCPECRQHFVVLAANRPSGVPAAIWLWRLHNGINGRLRKAVWPPASLCGPCRNGTVWDEAVVGAFLAEHYGPSSLRADGAVGGFLPA
eukprot:TRINITY_DN19322_c0_g1_i1.p1 TRINITY_DN19322_c0_g1~~TRINITY_DN19322_c0_g1_i1.p1  ORF type:complete len:298 (+),score=79.77 TRINITY_DN19322_c0_g1_i1:227-1120(+)